MRSKLFHLLVLNRFVLSLRSCIYYLFNLIYFPLFRYLCYAQLKRLSPETQVFLMTRPDFGTFLNSLLYVRCWQKARSKTCLVILTSQFSLVKELAKVICPETQLVFPLEKVAKWMSLFFGKNHVYYKTMLSTYAYLAIDKPNSIFIYDQPSIKGRNRFSNYVSFFDNFLKEGEKTFSAAFISAYKESRKILDFRHDVYYDFFNLYYESDNRGCIDPASEKVQALLQRLGIRRKYVVINTNLKHYLPKLDDKKRIQYPDRYNALIDLLIEKGFSVVIQGRGEQPVFKPREGLIDYARSPFTNVENDLLLYAKASFAICSKSGPEIFSALCKIPLLGLNYVELSSMQPNPKMRFYPKHIVNKAEGKKLSWQEMLTHASFFDIGQLSDQSVEYVDLEENEMVEALLEFLPLVDQNQWLAYTENQGKFRKALHPIHLDLFQVKSVPSECYLAKFSSSRV